MNEQFLGIDTSNYTTSAAICMNGQILLNEKKPVAVAAGERGVRQSEAVFFHVKNLPAVMEAVGKRKLTAVGCSAFPRDAVGSYMPCFLAGETLAKSVAALAGIPCYSFSHQAGHIAAAVWSSGAEQKLGNEFLAYHVSGGTTELLLVHTTEDGGYRIEQIGGTADLTAGQAIDRIGVTLGLSFPCGAALERLAEGNGFRKPHPTVEGLRCHLSGLENQAARMLADGVSKGEIAAYTLEFVKATLDRLTENALAAYPGLPLLFAGGVMSCRRMKDYFGGRYGAYFAEPQFSSDNAAGIAWLTERRYAHEHH